jgi:hypothetical protein
MPSFVLSPVGDSSKAAEFARWQVWVVWGIGIGIAIATAIGGGSR